jgi:hypothetical protein
VPALLKPRAVRPGATLGIAAPGGAVDPELLTAGVALLEGCGFRTRMRDDVLARHRYLAGDDARRAGELAELVADPGRRHPGGARRLRLRPIIPSSTPPPSRRPQAPGRLQRRRHFSGRALRRPGRLPRPHARARRGRRSAVLDA